MSLSREPVFKIPVVLIVVVAALIAIQALRGVLSPEANARIVAALAFVPIRLTALFDPAAIREHLATWGASNADDDTTRAGLAEFFLREGSVGSVATLLGYAALHGGWAHVGLNSIWLLAFGTPVARRVGTLRFILLGALAAVIGALTHWALFPFGVEPLVGASAAVSGYMGAALRFAFQSRPPALPEDEPSPILPLSQVFRQRQTVSFLIAWFVSNAIFGVGSMSFGLSDQPVAWQAHVGGFLAGLLLFRWFDPMPDPTPKAE